MPFVTLSTYILPDQPHRSHARYSDTCDVWQSCNSTPDAVAGLVPNPGMLGHVSWQCHDCLRGSSGSRRLQMAAAACTTLSVMYSFLFHPTAVKQLYRISVRDVLKFIQMGPKIHFWFSSSLHEAVVCNYLASSDVWTKHGESCGHVR